MNPSLSLAGSLQEVQYSSNDFGIRNWIVPNLSLWLEVRLVCTLEEAPSGGLHWPVSCNAPVGAFKRMFSSTTASASQVMNEWLF